MLVKMTKAAFRGFFEVILWVTLIGCVIAGIIFGLTTIQEGVGGVIVGLILGAIVGALTITLLGGLIATFLTMDENLKQLLEQSKTNVNAGFVSTESEIPHGETANLEKPPAKMINLEKPLAEPGFYIVRKNASLYETGNYDNVVSPLYVGNIVEYISSRDAVTIGNVTGQMWTVKRMADGKMGDCFSSLLEKQSP